MIPVLGVPAIRPIRLWDMLETVDVPVADFVFVDNSPDGIGLPDELPWAQRVWHLRMPSNLGVATSWNLIVKSTPFAPWWLIAPTDVRWPAGSLARIVDEVPQTGVLTGGGVVDWAWFALPSETVQRVGLFDEYFHPIYCEDIDYHRRVEANGMRVLHTSARVEHWNSTTINRHADLQKRNAVTYQANRRWLREKWGTSTGKLDDVDGAPLPDRGWDLRRRRELTWDSAR